MALLRVAVVGVLLAFAACDRGAPAAPTCEAATDALIKVLAPTPPKAESDERAQLAGLSVRCKQDKWSNDARTCIAKATTQPAQKDCWHTTLTQDQAEKLNAALPASADAKEAMRKMGEFADKMCACHDSKCAQVVSDEMTTWSQEMAKDQHEPPKLSEDDMKKATELGQRMGECMQKAMSADMTPIPEQQAPSPPETGSETNGGAM